MKISIIVPAFNEEAMVKAGNLREIRNWLSSKGKGNELILADDGSTDDTVEAAKNIPDKILKLPHRGKGSALVAGMESAEGDCWILFDIDLETPVEALELLIQGILQGKEVIYGTRSNRREDSPFIRRIASNLMTTFNRAILRLPVSDTQCGAKALTAEAGHVLLPQLKAYVNQQKTGKEEFDVTADFDLAMLSLAMKAKLKIGEAPVPWKFLRNESRYSIWRQGLRLAYRTFAFRLGATRNVTHAGK